MTYTVSGGALNSTQTKLNQRCGVWLARRFLQMEEGVAEWKRASLEDDAELALRSFRRPRNLLLCTVAACFRHNVGRWRVLRRLLADSAARPPDPLDHKTHSVRA